MRRRYRFDEETKQMVEVSLDWQPTERRAPVCTEEIVYGGVAATDGTAINTRKKHREYMKQNGLAMISDYEGGYLERKAKERVETLKGEGRGEAEKRKQAISQAYDKIMTRRKY